MATNNNKMAPVKASDTSIAKATNDITPSLSFANKVERQFKAELGTRVNWSDMQKTMAQHLYVKIDAALQAAEIKRAGNDYTKGNPAITWANANMEKLALDAVNRVSLHLDAAIANHLHVIPYLNKRTQKYDLDIRIGYMGVDHCRRKFASEEPLKVIYKLVFETDQFDYGTNDDGIEWYSYKQTNPFNPGAVIGGFGYIQYADPKKNRVVIVQYREFEKAMKASKGVEFWGGEQTVYQNGKKAGTEYDEKFRQEMMYKTVVLRVASTIPLDPAKVNAASLVALEHADVEAIEADVVEEINQNAGKKQLALGPPTQEPEEQTSTADEETGEVIEQTPEEEDF